MNIRELIDNTDPSDLNFCLDALEVARKLAKYGQIAVNANNGTGRMGRDDARELAVAVLDFGSLIRAFEYRSPSGEEAEAFRKAIVEP